MYRDNDNILFCAVLYYNIHSVSILSQHNEKNYINKNK